MNKLFKSFLIIVTFVFISGTLQAEEIVLTTLAGGKIAIKEPGEKKYKQIKQGDVIEVGSWIMTLKKTDATLTFYKTDEETGDSNSTLQLGSYTKLKIDSFDAAKEKVTTEIKARAGHIISSVDPEESKGNNYQVETPQVTAAVKGTRLEIITNSKSTRVKTLSGDVLSSSAHGSKSILKNQLTDVDSEGMSSSIDIKLLAAQNAAVYTGSSSAEAAFQNTTSLVPVGGSSTGLDDHQAFQSANNQTQSTSSASFVPVCWEYFGPFPFPIYPTPHGCDPLPPAPPVLIP